MTKPIRKFCLNVSSGRSINFTFSEKFTLDDMGLDEEEWAEMSEQERETALDDYAMLRLFDYYIGYGVEEIQED